MNKSALIQRFSLALPAQYAAGTMARVAHLKDKELQQAAILIGLVERDDGLHLILTKRAEHLKHHPGQISFPGGRYEAFDAGLQQTALRETEEEIGIDRALIDVVGQLPALATVSKYNVTPFVAFVDASYQATIDYNEVEYLFEVPVNFVLSPKNLVSYPVRFGMIDHDVLAIPYKQHFIWGMTAQIIQALQLHLSPINQPND